MLVIENLHAEVAGKEILTGLEGRVLALPGVAQADVELVWEPPWDGSRLSEAARLELGLW